MAPALLFSGFAMIALQNVNYAVFSLFLTAMLVFALHVSGEDALEGGIARLLATLLGVAIAFGGIPDRHVRPQSGSASLSPPHGSTRPK